MIRRAALLAAAAALLVTLAYQRAAPATVALGSAGDLAITEGFGAAGMSQGQPWRWTTRQSRVRLLGAGQIAPGGGAIRVELGVPRWAGDRPRRTTLALDGTPLGIVSVISGFAVHEFPVPGEHDADGDWILSLATEGVTSDRGEERGVALARVEILPATSPSLPALRTLLAVVLGAIALAALLLPWFGTPVASAAGAAAAAGAAVALAFARPQAVETSWRAAWALALLLAVDRIRRGRWGDRLGASLKGLRARWIEAVAPPLALAGLIFPSFGLWSVPAFGVSALLALLWLARVKALPTQGSFSDEPLRHPTLIVSGLTALAFAFRLYHLEDVPFAIFRDEARHGLLALRLLAEPSYRPLFVGPPINQPLPYFLGVAAAIRAFGVDLFALRIVSAVAGALAVPLLFRLVREVIGPREAVVASLLLAVSSWHVSISRFAVNYVEPSLFSLPAYLLLWRALPRARATGIGLAALLIGLGQYTAHTAKPLLVVAAGLAADEVVRRFLARDGGIRKLGLSLAVGVVLGLVTVGPILLFVGQNPGAYLARAEQVSIWTNAAKEGGRVDRLLVQNLRSYAGAFHVSGDPNGRHHLPLAPLLDPVSGLGLLAGLGLALSRPSSRANRFLLLWMLAGILPGLLTVDAPSALRIVEAAPAVYGVAALGLVAVWERGVRTWSGRSKALVAAVLASAIAWNGWTYFARMYDSPLVWISSAAIGTQVGRRLQELRRAGTLPEKMLLAVPRSFFEDPDNRFVLAFFCPRGLKLGIYDDPVPLERPADALLLPNDEELWRLAAARDAHYAVQLARARLAEAEWLRRSNSPYRPSILTGPPFPGTRAPTFWLYIRRPEDERTAERQEPR